jgi:hypothetical protein
MSTYLICRDRSLDPEQAAVFEQTLAALGAQEGDHASVRNMWIVNSGMKRESIQARLNDALQQPCDLLISELAGDWRRTGLDSDTRRWLKEHLLKAV